VGAVVLNHDSTEDTLGCLRALGTSTHRWIAPVVVDTADGQVLAPKVAATSPGATVLPLGENLGYAGGNNVGITWSLEHDLDLVVLINPDVRVEPGTLEALLRAMDADRRIGLAGCRMVHGDDPDERIWFDGGSIDRSRGGATTHLGAGEPSAAREEVTAPTDVDYLTGALLLIRREVIEDIGPLPERWFLYFEETQYNLDAQAAGWRTTLVPGTKARHYKRSSGRLAQPYYIYYYVRNRLIFARDVIRVDPAVALEDLGPFLDHWRGRTRDHAPSGLAAFDRVVDTAMDHGLRGVSGRFDGLHELGTWR
jgi:GT2 family glycosyltransferase